MLPGDLIGSSPFSSILVNTLTLIARVLAFSVTRVVVLIVTIEDLSATVGAIIALFVIVYKIVLDIFSTDSEKADLCNARTKALIILKMYLNATPLVENWTAVALFFLSAEESSDGLELESSDDFELELDSAELKVDPSELEVEPSELKVDLSELTVASTPNVVVSSPVPDVVEAGDVAVDVAFVWVVLIIVEVVIVVAVVVVAAVVVVGAFSGFASIASIALLTPSIASKFSTRRVFWSCNDNFVSGTT